MRRVERLLLESWLAMTAGTGSGRKRAPARSSRVYSSGSYRGQWKTRSPSASALSGSRSMILWKIDADGVDRSE